ncbi:MAG TPA: NAD(P)H-binding protein [Myxococcota bacterium]|nr:NAD(P)H-binding protein [Myxococcota bacterium]
MSERLVLVTGANGRIGLALCRRLAEEGPPRRALALVRSERAAAAVRALPARERPEVAIADYRDADSIAEYTARCEAAVHLVGLLKETRANRYVDAHERACTALSAAADRTGLRRIVSLSILGADPDSPNACLASRARADAILLRAKTSAVVIRLPMVLGAGDPASAALARQARGPRARLVRGGASLDQPIAARDVVSALAAALDRPGLDDAVLELAGPESLPHRDLVLRAASVLGTQVSISTVPAPLACAAAWLAERLSTDPPITRAMLGVLEHDDAIDPEPARAKLGLALTPLDTALREALASGAR